MPVLTTSQIATLQRVLATCNNVLPRIEMLEQVAKINPQLQTRVGELRNQREYLCQLATATLEIERQLGGAVNVPTVQQSSGMVSPPGPSMLYSPPPPPYTSNSPPPPPIYTSNSPPPAQIINAGIPSGPDTPYWDPTESVPVGTRRLIAKMPILGSYGTPTRDQQTAANQYGWNFVTVQGDAFYAVKV